VATKQAQMEAKLLDEAQNWLVLLKEKPQLRDGVFSALFSPDFGSVWAE